jgi:hypothetical protein
VQGRAGQGGGVGRRLRLIAVSCPLVSVGRCARRSQIAAQTGPAPFGRRATVSLQHRNRDVERLWFPRRLGERGEGPDPTAQDPGAAPADGCPPACARRGGDGPAVAAAGRHYGCQVVSCVRRPSWCPRMRTFCPPTIPSPSSPPRRTSLTQVLIGDAERHTGREPLMTNRAGPRGMAGRPVSTAATARPWRPAGTVRAPARARDRAAPLLPRPRWTRRHQGGGRVARPPEAPLGQGRGRDELTQGGAVTARVGSMALRR